MEKDTQELIRKIATEIGGAMQQGRDREVSGLFRDIKKDVEEIKTALIDFDKRSVNWDNTQRIVYGLVALMLTALVGALVGLVIV